MDHEQFLGSDIRAIAAEKAGILKPSVNGMPVIISQQDEDALEVIMARAIEYDLPPNVLRTGLGSLYRTWKARHPAPRRADGLAHAGTCGGAPNSQCRYGCDGSLSSGQS